MTTCDLDVVLYFYDEMTAGDRVRMEAHLRSCAACRQRLDDLYEIRDALAAQPVVNAPPAGDWSGFMRRLDDAVATSKVRSRESRIGVPQMAAMAAMVAVVATGVFIASRFRAGDRTTQTAA